MVASINETNEMSSSETEFSLNNFQNAVSVIANDNIYFANRLNQPCLQVILTMVLQMHLQ